MLAKYGCADGDDTYSRDEVVSFGVELLELVGALVGCLASHGELVSEKS